MPLIDSRPTPLAQLRGLTAAEVAKLKAASISNNEQLLAATKTRSAEVKLAKQTGIGLSRMREAVNRADLVRIDGIGPAAADLFENAGVNSVKELAQRNPTSLHAALVKYAATRPELGYQVPSAGQVKGLVTKAGLVVAPAPVKPPQEQAADAMHLHIENVLFGNHPDGQTFRDAVVSWRTPTAQEALENQMHVEVAGFFGAPDTERYETPTTITWAGRWADLYSEVTVKKTGGVERVWVEID
jgi:predicted flap endonuclease-1-like 5' DNA nuclease